MPSSESPSGCSDTGSWLTPKRCSVSIASPDAVRRPRQDDRRQVGAVVTVRQQLAHAHDGARRRQQAVGPHPLVVVQLGQVVAAAVRKDHHDDRVLRRRRFLADESLAFVQRGDHRGPARLPGQDPLLARDPAGHGERVPVADTDPAVDDGGIVGPREEVLAHALGQVAAGDVAGQDAALRVRTDHPDRRVLRLEVAGRARDRAAGTDAGHQVRDPALRLLPDLGTRRLLVRRRVLHVPVLVRLEGSGDVAGEARGHGVVALRRLRRDVGGAQHDLRAVRPQEGLLLRRLLVGHHEDAAVAAQRGGDGQAVTRVAGRGLDDGPAGPQEAGLLGGLDHRQADPVLDGAARVEHLQLGQQQRPPAGGTEAARQARDLHERRVADEVEDRGRVLHGCRIPARSG